MKALSIYAYLTDLRWLEAAPVQPLNRHLARTKAIWYFIPDPVMERISAWLYWQPKCPVRTVVRPSPEYLRIFTRAAISFNSTCKT